MIIYFVTLMCNSGVTLLEGIRWWSLLGERKGWLKWDLESLSVGRERGGTRLWRWDTEEREGLGNAIFFQWDFLGKRCYVAKQGNLKKQATTTIVKVEVKWYDKKEKNDLQLNLVAARWWIRNEAFWQTEVSWRHEYSLYSVEKRTERKTTWKWRPYTSYRK